MSLFCVTITNMRNIVQPGPLLCTNNKTIAPVSFAPRGRFHTNLAYASPAHTTLAWSGVSLIGVSFTLFVVALLLSLRR